MADNQNTTTILEPVEIPGFPGYFATKDGQIWTSKLKGGNDRTPGRTGNLRLLRVRQSRRGYCVVNFDVHGRNRSLLVHQLILKTFVGPKPDGMEGCHYPDHDKGNNRVENLRWDTHQENIKDGYRDRPPVTEKCCRRCGAVKSVTEFYTDHRASDGLHTTCKPCHVAISMSTADREKKRTANRNYMRRWREKRGAR